MCELIMSSCLYWPGTGTANDTTRLSSTSRTVVSMRPSGHQFAAAGHKTKRRRWWRQCDSGVKSTLTTRPSHCLCVMTSLSCILPCLSLLVRKTRPSLAEWARGCNTRLWVSNRSRRKLCGSLTLNGGCRPHWRVLRSFESRFEVRVAFELNSEILRKFRDNFGEMFFAQTNHLLGPVRVQWKYFTVTRWYQSCLAISGWLLSGQRVLINSSTMSRKCWWGHVGQIVASQMIGLSEKHFLDIV